MRLHIPFYGANMWTVALKGSGVENTSSNTNNLQNITWMVYGLQFLSLFTGFAAIIGVIVNIVKRDDARQDPLIDAHFRWQMRTFWWTLGLTLLGALLWVLVIGIFIVLGVGIWYVYRMLRGALALSDDKPPAPNY